MEKFDIIVPTPGESISEVEIGSWLVENGSWVDQDQEIASIESEKASLEITSPSAGFLEIIAQEGEAVAVGSLMGKITPGDNPDAGNDKENRKDDTSVNDKTGDEKEIDQAKETLVNGDDEELVRSEDPAVYQTLKPANENVKITPVARKIMKANNLSIDDVINGLRRITKQDIEQVLSAQGQAQNQDQSQTPAAMPLSGDRKEERKRMSLLRRKLSERLVTVKNETAMLTTFNELDMSAVMSLRTKYKQAFEKKHGIKLGFMSFFSLAAARALQAFPQINSSIEGEELVSYNYADIGIAMQAPKGLMVPVIRDVHMKNLAQIEADIAALAQKARSNKISMDELKGGTFSITNGGVFGSLLSTPILNPPQSAILGMHNIVDRPIAIDQQVVIRPMMYIALSYDHRIVDGKDSVGFLKTIKELIENPFKLLDPAGKPENSLFDL